LALFLGGGVGGGSLFVSGLTILATLAAEQDEGVLWPLDVVLIALLGTTVVGGGR
jgi:hypothetical protein